MWTEIIETLTNDCVDAYLEGTGVTHKDLPDDTLRQKIKRVVNKALEGFLNSIELMEMKEKVQKLERKIANLEKEGVSSRAQTQ